jgi:beta-glucosidase
MGLMPFTVQVIPQGATLFPQQIGMAATFNTELVKKELKFRHMKLGHPLFHGFFPDLDLPRNPWSRMWSLLGRCLFI